ncbi:membrane fusion protein (multidrug efflux system) [Desulfosalsimonas propionicica]|uniref:Membrane fusion protein (Multidrug efflux system) n=1 Tax=Desulfosalsimonas propionicica TaxID=332175 RepID=A0A7W0CAN4_9BACT|nr:efflux RND transporter periplasmic adaptor subunit [Desulfosalsimonas propionicica]MBA2882177.1 membrane fusion protein (multidrug efflux system) [Desulfosalsimonas propionicica]
MKADLWILIFSLIMVPVSGSAAPEDQGPKGPPPLVQVAAVDLENARKPEKFVGHVEAIVSIDLRARVEGYLEKVNFCEGAAVDKGQLLYVIEQGPYQTRVDSAKAGVIQAEADLFKARTRLGRLQSARPESVSKTDLDDARAARDLARGRLQEAEAGLELAEINLDYTTIEAPIKGRVGQSFYKQGDLVGPSSGPLAEIVRMDPIRVVFSMNESNMDMLHHVDTDTPAAPDGKELTVRVRFPGKKVDYAHEGKIEFIDNRMDPETGTIAVRARFDNPEGQLVPGRYVNVFVQPDQPDMQPAVLQRAVQQDRDGRFVFVVNQNAGVEKRRIGTGPVIGDKVIVQSGLSQGETVIVEGIQKVSPGIRVKTRTDEKEDF